MSGYVGVRDLHHDQCDLFDVDSMPSARRCTCDLYRETSQDEGSGDE